MTKMKEWYVSIPVIKHILDLSYLNLSNSFLTKNMWQALKMSQYINQLQQGCSYMKVWLGQLTIFGIDQVSILSPSHHYTAILKGENERGMDSI